MFYYTTIPNDKLTILLKMSSSKLFGVHGPARPKDLGQPLRITDPEIKAQLEGFRLRVPRYLFRGWSERSGGNEKCNSTTAITPRAFIQGPAHESIYDMGTEVLKTMVFNHLKGHDHVPTEFSSWAASISHAMTYCQRPYSSFISIIDTKKLGKKVEIFYAADLSGFFKGPRYPGEYLAHGIIDGDYHRAVSFRAFTDLKIPLFNLRILASDISGHLQSTERFVYMCRRIGEQTGPRFSIVVALAIIAFFMTSRRPPTKSVSLQERKIIEEELGDLTVPEKWYNDDSIMKDIVADFDWPVVEQLPEVKQLIELLRLFANRLRKNHEEKERRELEERRWQEEEGDASDEHDSQEDYKPTKVDSDQILRTTKGHSKVTKSKQHPLLAKREKYIAKEMKRLDINLKGWGGKEANNGQDGIGMHGHIDGGAKKGNDAKDSAKHIGNADMEDV